MKLLRSKLSVARNIPLDRGQLLLNPKEVGIAHKRDKGKCLFCGWQERSKGMLRFVAVNGVYDQDVKSSKIASSCEICFQASRLGYVAYASAGQIMYCPELQQKDINALARLYFSIPNTESTIDEPAELLNSFVCLTTYFDTRCRETPIYLDIQGYNLENLASSLCDMDDDLYEKRVSYFDKLRYWPNMTYLQKVVGNQWDYISKINSPTNWKLIKNQIENFANENSSF
ncbi:hypothetical protein GCM10011607_28480 [Shewanella inventionis]|uniref:Uncharacterized protein n=1 Tax=Shewanella inventionis TaxID=1738770 RepID=A0ABQ1JH09_9GAMM|nr:hypothetical protein [Shewanella inventionis]GGB66087.1 hypothetical protein GCM10011607_28480 [Shewanella inventionis]